MTRLFGRIELIANLCIIALAIVIGGLLAKRFHFKSPEKLSDVSISAGTKVTLQDIDWSKNDKTLLLVISTQCKFCSASASFYRQLATNAEVLQKAKVVALLPQSVQEGRGYLRSLDVPIDDIRQVSPSAIGVKATPTLILVNNSGTVTDSWVGQLQADKEAEVLAKLKLTL